ncbi:biotin synthase BioB [Brevibacterium sediminis]|uniref:biotin synthase BioB n=1 Tax=Brevibacterium sediminis TaxID=1857024 RepID=UPI002175463F|nr:biotin synthase BioB [Brevibacterium sediminis]MCS4591913.1 biotin synthase BioB [Brevibacterium sediminis]
MTTVNPDQNVNPGQLAESILNGGAATEADALTLLATPDEELFGLVHAGSRLRREHFGMTIKLNYLVNLKSGMCPESCTYCSQSLGSKAEILKYSWLSTDEAMEQASMGIGGGASRVCLVASGRGPSRRDVGRVGEIVERLKDENPEVEVCACLGLLKEGQAEALKEAGADAYNHNINTAESFHDNIVKTHTYEDRTNTVEHAKAAGLSPCSGLIVGLGESDEQIVEALFALKALGSESIPINFLVPFDGTPLEGQWNLTPMQCMKIVATARFVCPDREIRLAGGREIHLKSLQPMALQLANSIFLGDYLTAEGQAAADDLAMIRDNGFTILGQEDEEARTEESVGCCGAEAGCCSDRQTPAEAVAHTDPVIRRRGAGTAEVANA